MIITKEQILAMVIAYEELGHDLQECTGFIDGINETISLVDRILSKESLATKQYRPKTNSYNMVHSNN